MDNQHAPELEQLLSANCDRIEVVLTRFSIRAAVVGGTVGTTSTQYEVLPALGEKVSRLPGLLPELTAALDAPKCSVRQAGRMFVIDVPHVERARFGLMDLWKEYLAGPDHPPATAILGRQNDGTLLAAALTSPDVTHILLAGTTGSGKTELLRTIGLSLALGNPAASLRLMVIDPQNEKLAQLGQLRHCLWGPIADPLQALAALQRLVDQLDRATKSPLIVVLIDELADLVMTAGAPAERAIARLLQRGREAGIHVVAAAQKPSAAVLGPLMKANFPLRICGAVTSASDAHVALGWPGTGAERQPGRGTFVAVAAGQVIRFQAPLPEVDKIIAGMPHARRPVTERTGPHPLDLVRPLEAPDPDPVVDDDTRLAQKLLAWEYWPGRRVADGTDYRWGFTSAACSYLFDRDAAGTWYRRTARAINLAEQMETDRYRAGCDVPSTTQGGFAIAPAPTCQATRDNTLTGPPHDRWNNHHAC